MLSQAVDSVSHTKRVCGFPVKSRHRLAGILYLCNQMVRTIDQRQRRLCEIDLA